MTQNAHSVVQEQPSGVLYVVATPIGNLDDLSSRARQILSSVAVVAAEDTRHSSKLLQLVGGSATLLSLHEHNEHERVQQLIARLRAGEDIALISDAGTPLISDPGFVLVRELTQQGIRVVPIPGACAAIAALSVAGLPTDKFAFEGFLPARQAKRRERLQELARVAHTLVFYEAPHRCAETLNDLALELGETRRAAVCRELTKVHETCYYGELGELSARAATDTDMSRGEIVIVVAGNDLPAEQQQWNAEQVLKVLLQELPASQAAKLAARICNADRAALYELAVKSKSTQ